MGNQCHWPQGVVPGLTRVLALVIMTTFLKQCLFLSILQVEKSKLNMQGNPVSDESPPPGLQTAVFSPSPGGEQ